MENATPEEKLQIKAVVKAWCGAVLNEEHVKKMRAAKKNGAIQASAEKKEAMKAVVETVGETFGADTLIKDAVKAIREAMVAKAKEMDESMELLEVAKADEEGVQAGVKAWMEAHSLEKLSDLDGETSPCDMMIFIKSIVVMIVSMMFKTRLDAGKYTAEQLAGWEECASAEN